MKTDVLMLDDNLIDIKVIEVLAKKNDLVFSGFLNPSQAMDFLKSNEVKVILLDLTMPKASGFDLLPVFKKNWPKTPIIILSGRNQLEDVAKAIKLGASDYIIKPVDHLVVQEKLSRYRESNQESFHSLDITSMEIVAQMAQDFQVTEVNEFGLSVLSEFEIPAGRNFTIRGLPPEIFVVDNILVLSVGSNAVDERKFKTELTYVGLSEAQRQVIRNSCRKIWIQRRGL